jgi:hypothetical protein
MSDIRLQQGDRAHSDNNATPEAAVDFADAARAEVHAARAEVHAARTEVNGARTEVNGARTEVHAARAEDSSKPEPTKTSFVDQTRTLLRDTPIADHALSAVSARLAYFGVTDQLHVDHFTMRKGLGRLDTPVAKQLVGVMDDLVANDWQFVKESSLSTQGGSYNQFSRQLRYTERWALPGYLFGQSPVKRALAYPFAHELGHHKPPLSYYADPKTPAGEIMAKRYLLAEAKAMLTEVHISDALRVTPHPLTQARKTALGNGTLGTQILSDHAFNTEALRRPDVPRAVQESSANRLVNTYLEETYGRNLVDPSTGKVRPFDFKAGINAPHIAEIADDGLFRSELVKEGNYKEIRKEPLFDQRSKLGKLSLLGETHTGSVFMRGAKAAGAIGGMLMVTDVVGAFQESSRAGFGRIGKLATEIGGFEAGTAIGTAGSLKVLAKFPKAQLVATLGTGVLGAYGAGEYVGQYVETMIKGSSSELAAKRPMTPAAQRVLKANLPIR